MPTTPAVIESSFTNRYGDEWSFSFNTNTNLASVKGSDVGWESYPVIEGVAYGLVMDGEEKTWLLSVWMSAAADRPVSGLYRDMPTDFVAGTSYSYLTNDYCPICLSQKLDFEIHHCIWASDGGSDTPSNLLRTCNSCHAVITRGSEEERVPKNLAALHHQVMHYGFALFREAIRPETNKAAKHYATTFPATVDLLTRVGELNSEEQKAADRQLKAESRISYQYFRDLGLGKWNWSDHKRMFVRSDKLFQDDADV